MNAFQSLRRGFPGVSSFNSIFSATSSSSSPQFASPLLTTQRTVVNVTAKKRKQRNAKRAKKALVDRKFFWIGENTIMRSEGFQILDLHTKDQERFVYLKGKIYRVPNEIKGGFMEINVPNEIKGGFMEINGYSLPVPPDVSKYTNVSK
eukprot:Awhi_evm1s4196